MKLALTRVLVKNNMIIETLPYGESYKIVKRTVDTNSKVICDYIYKKSMNISHMQKIFFESGLRTLNKLTEVCQSIMIKEKSEGSGGKLNWKI